MFFLSKASSKVVVNIAAPAVLSCSKPYRGKVRAHAHIYTYACVHTHTVLYLASEDYKRMGETMYFMLQMYYLILDSNVCFALRIFDAMYSDLDIIKEIFRAIRKMYWD